MMEFRLAELACKRARLQHAISTARACGDHEYCREYQPILESVDRRVEILKKVVRPEVLREAREITNAPI